MERQLGIGWDRKDERVPVAVRVVPPTAAAFGGRKPADVVLVVDVSGSMNTAALYEAPDGSMVDNGLSILDIVKHACKTVAHILEPGDRLGLVAFNHEATVHAQLTPTDGGGGLAKIVTKIEGLVGHPPHMNSDPPKLFLIPKDIL